MRTAIPEPAPLTTPAADSPVTMFVHLPKTAGTTFNSLLSYQYGHRRSLWVPWDNVDLEQTLLRLSPEKRQRLNLIRGHFPFGWHEFLERPVRYITMLRHPVDRVISMYYYFRTGPDCHEQRLARSSRSIEDFVTREATTMVENDQVRRLSGQMVGFGEVDSTIFQTALSNLNDRFCCVGLTERFDESILLMAQQLHWTRPVFYLSSNVTRQRPSLQEISAQARRLIEKYNEFDLALYEKAVQRFTAAVEVRRAEIDREKQRLERRNRLASRLLPGPLWMLRRMRFVLTNQASNATAAE